MQICLRGKFISTATSTPAPSPDQTPPGTPPNEAAVDNVELDALMPDLVRENRAKGVVLRAYRVDGKSSPLEPAAARRESLRRTKRGSQELDAQGLVSKLSRLVQWPFQGFVSDGNGNSVRTSDHSVQLTSHVTTTSTLTGERLGHPRRNCQDGLRLGLYLMTGYSMQRLSRQILFSGKLMFRFDFQTLSLR